MTVPTIEAALLALASVDTDRASQQNGVGFNGRDTGFGNSLADQLKAGGQLSPRQAAAAYKMLRTYRTQLARDHGIEYAEIPAPASPGAAAASPAPGAQRQVRAGGAAGVTKAAPAPTPGRTITLDAGRAQLAFPYDPAMVDRVRGIPGRRWVKATKVWSVPVDPATLPHLQQLVAEGFEVVGGSLDDADAEAQAAVAASQAAAADLVVDGLGGELMPFQRAAVAYALGRRATLIGDEMGLGKTVQALATCQATGAFPALVVCPSVVKLNWEREARRWLPGRSVSVLQGRTPSTLALGADVVVINYDVVGAWADVLAAAGFRALIADESHYLKNRKAQRTKAVGQLATAPELERVMLLTGTAILNRPIELAEQLRILGVLDDLGGFWSYAQRYCEAEDTGWGWDMSGAAHLDELHTRLRALCYVRRVKADVLAELPAKRRAVVPMELADAGHYAAVERDLAVWLRDRVEADPEVAALTGAEREAAIRRALGRMVSGGGAEVLTRIEALKQTAVAEKLVQVRAWVDEFLATGKKLVVFAWHRDVVRELAKAYGAPMIMSGVSDEARQAAVDRFQTDDSCRMIVCNIAAGGVGITLTAASDVAFVELPWRPGDLDQAEDRCHRIGQHDSVTAWYLLAAGTIEEEIAEVLDTKRQVVSAVLDGAEAEASGILLSLLGTVLGREEGVSA
jgi:hypothetical protein